ncbi:smad nuclear-interacting protein 1 [Monoraphidium neglectum]|uniref:Smad nuclear-interacting protein 1 n=1 Tax=Monoraphidium neglectum TaxID=145388 RepID=A0A0D2LWD6_9CHLO|nr:smad nuclear-interacting protein 1 [Monoraphidium neglectum]KIY95804.1 smad nuclear-interacting protein 1 [Monoraphidium neglectum]|eukprot:XP_013894824.1 smad nuclear-interacting protein 1 [Monoraphidium neglectum]
MEQQVLDVVLAWGLGGLQEVNGVVMKFQPPPEARRCTSPRWRLYVFKGDTQASPGVGDPLPLDKFPFFLFGKERRVADIPTDHPSCSRQHAVICFREVERASSLSKVVVPYIIDLETVNGTFVNGERIEASRYVELLERDVIKFGLSSREYVLLNEKSAG